MYKTLGVTGSLQKSTLHVSLLLFFHYYSLLLIFEYSYLYWLLRINTFKTWLFSTKVIFSPTNLKRKLQRRGGGGRRMCHSETQPKNEPNKLKWERLMNFLISLIGNIPPDLNTHPPSPLLHKMDNTTLSLRITPTEGGGRGKIKIFNCNKNFPIGILPIALFS